MIFYGEIRNPKKVYMTESQIAMLSEGVFFTKNQDCANAPIDTRIPLITILYFPFFTFPLEGPTSLKKKFLRPVGGKRQSRAAPTLGKYFSLVRAQIFPRWRLIEG